MLRGRGGQFRRGVGVGVQGSWAWDLGFTPQKFRKLES